MYRHPCKLLMRLSFASSRLHKPARIQYRSTSDWHIHALTLDVSLQKIVTLCLIRLGARSLLLTFATLFL